MERSLFSQVCSAITEYEQRARRNRALGGVMDLGGGWPSYIEDAEKEPVEVYWEIAEVFENLFGCRVGTDEIDSEMVDLCFELGSKWLNFIIQTEGEES